jgi:hypothetical protein
MKENGEIAEELKRLKRENSGLIKEIGKLELVVYGKVTRRIKSPRKTAR